MELEMPNLRQTSSCVVSRCRLSSTTFSLYSAEYCLRLASIMSSTFLRLCFPYLPIYSIRYWTGVRILGFFLHLILQFKRSIVSNDFFIYFFTLSFGSCCAPP